MPKKFEPLVSIVIPVYNGSNYLSEAIDSALFQTYKNIEVIVINDGSKDDGKTEEVALSYGNKIKYLTKVNGGVATALNLGIEKMQGDYFSWLSHDDMYTEDKIEKQIEALSIIEDKKTIITGGYKVVNSSGEYLHEVDPMSLHPIEKLENSVYPLFHGMIHGCAILIHKSHFERVGVFETTLPTTQDFELFFRMLRGQKIIFQKELYVKSRSHDEQDSKKLVVSHLEECNELWISMISRLTLEEKCQLYGTEYAFYNNIYYFLKNSMPYDKATEFAHSCLIDAREKFTPQVLLLTDVPPCTNFSGGIFLNQLSEILINEKVNLFGYFMPPHGINLKFDQYVINQMNYRIFNYIDNDYNNEQEKEYYLNNIQIIVNNTIDFLINNDITMIWCYIQCENVLRILDEVYKKINIPYVVQIMDPIEWYMKDRKFNDEKKEELLKIFDGVITNAYYCFTASQNMNHYYKEKYQVNCDYITVSNEENNFSYDYHLRDHDQFVIAMAGQIYCDDELKCFLQALEKMNWKYNNKSIIFKFFGKFVREVHGNIFDSFSSKNIIFMDYLPQSELDIELNKCDLLYCPYFFSNDEVFEKIALQSFPSKLVTYLNAGTNIVVHGPYYCSPASFIRYNKCGYVINSLNVTEIQYQLEEILANIPSSEILENSKKTFDENFTKNIISAKFLKPFNVKPNNERLKILEVNNFDIYGARFNGYDMIQDINNNTHHILNQIVTNKYSNNNRVFKFYENSKIEQLEVNFRNFEDNVLSIHSQFSVIGEFLLNSDVFKQSNFIHYHMIHNTKIPLSLLTHLFAQKPTVITIHDPWNFTGRCVHPFECKKWQTGCESCEHLDSLFSFKEDNCKYLWSQKEKINKEWDIDIIVSTNYLNEEFVKQSPITKHFKNVHVLPFGVDLNKFQDNGTKMSARKELGIPENDIVIFFRSQVHFKGIEFIVEALQQLDNSNNNITLVTCSEIGNLSSVRKKYNIVELGNIVDDQVIMAFNICDIFLMPTKGETFGVMAIEAMACSRPIIVFDNMTLPSITFTPDCGVLVENKNSQKLMEAIKFLIDNPDERLRRGQLGRELAEQYYDVNIYNKKIIEIYEKASERQKYKLESKTASLDFDFDISNTNVQKLIYTIKQNYKSLFGNNIIPLNFELKNLKFTLDLEKISKSKLKENSKDLNKNIDYSDDEVMKFLNYFNHQVYKYYKDEAFFTYNTTNNIINNINTATAVIAESNVSSNVINSISNYVDAVVVFDPIANRSKLYKMYYYARHDRFSLKQAVKRRLTDKPTLYNAAKKSYKFLKMVIKS